MEHRYHGPQDHDEPWQSEGCNACVLSYCEVCKGGECELTDECPGRPTTAEERELICEGVLEYFLGCWWHSGKIVWTDKLGVKVAYK